MNGMVVAMTTYRYFISILVSASLWWSSLPLLLFSLLFSCPFLILFYSSSRSPFHSRSHSYHYHYLPLSLYAYALSHKLSIIFYHPKKKEKKNKPLKTRKYWLLQYPFFFLYFGRILKYRKKRPGICICLPHREFGCSLFLSSTQLLRDPFVYVFLLRVSCRGDVRQMTCLGSMSAAARRG